MDYMRSIASLAAVRATYCVEDDYRRKAEIKKHPKAPRKGQGNQYPKGKKR